MSNIVCLDNSRPEGPDAARIFQENIKVRANTHLFSPFGSHPLGSSFFLDRLVRFRAFVYLIYLHDMDSSLKSLKALLELVGIEAISDTQIESVDTLQHLMGVTLQCLGGVRQLIHILEKERLSKVAVGEPDDQNFLGIRDTFVHAATKFLEASSGGFGIVNDLDPAKHLIESFPDEHKLADARWTKIHWAILCHSKLKSPLESIDALVRHDPDTIRELDREST